MRKLFKVLLIIIVLIGAYILIYTSVFSYDDSSPKMKVLDTSDTTNSFYISESNYAETMKTVVARYVDSLAISSSFNNAGHTNAYNMYLLDNPKANVVISHGFTERKEKYKEAIYYFLKMGYQVFILDHYGHGASSRSTPDSSLVYVEHYEVFVNDLHEFIRTVVKKHSKGVKTILFGHSMGGGIAAIAVEKYPNVVDGLILSSPLMKIGTPKTPPDYIADPVSRAMVLFGKGATYALGHRAYNPELDQTYKPSNPTTFSTIKGKYWHDYLLSITQHPSNGAS